MLQLPRAGYRNPGRPIYDAGWPDPFRNPPGAARKRLREIVRVRRRPRQQRYRSRTAR